MTLVMMSFLAVVSCKKDGLATSFELSKDKITFGSSKAEGSFTVTTESNWKAESSEPSWCEVSPANGEGSSLIKVKVINANTASDDRVAIITVTVAGNKKMVEVTQKGFAAISVSSPGLEVDYNTKTTSVDVESSEGWAIVPASLPSWVSADKASTEKGGTSTVTFTLQENSTELVRYANIIFKINNKPDSTVFNITQYTARGNGRKSDSLALVAILSNIDQPSHAKTFDFTKNMDTWRGVTLTRFGMEYRVTGLDLYKLSSFTVPGTGTETIPDDVESCWRENAPLPADIGFLDELTTLSCGSIDYQGIPTVHIGIGGQLPETMGKLVKLTKLSLQNNNLEGALPSSMRSLVKLTDLQLYNNKFTGELPSFIGEFIDLETLNCSYNQFSPVPNAFSKMQSLKSMDISYQGVPKGEGDDMRYESAATFNFPSSLLQLKKLEILTMIDCGLTGPLPADLGSMIGLQELRAYNNDLSGSLPTTIEKILRLRILNLANNKLDGIIPPELGNCQLLQALILGNNLLTGTLPDDLGKCLYLQVVELYQNKLSGQITPAFLRAAGLAQLNIAENDFEGVIPDDIVNHKNQLSLLDISGNRFTGITDRIGEATNLQFLLAGGNLLTTIPKTINLLKVLTNLNLGDNNIVGSIPESIGNLSNLEPMLDQVTQQPVIPALVLKGNRLSGAIPENLLTHRNQGKFDWAVNICPQQDTYVLTGCPGGNGVRGRASSARR